MLDLPSLFAEFAPNLRKERQLAGIVQVRESDNSAATAKASEKLASWHER
jgi:hypothetical protein